MRLEAKSVLVTGGATGIGRAIALRFAEEGAFVTIAGPEREALEETAAELRLRGRGAATALGDVSLKADAQRMVETAVREGGRLDALVSNAGICRPAPFLDISEEEWDRHLDVNLKGAFLTGQAAAREMALRGGGVIIHMSSVNGLAAEGDQAHYNASKGGLNLLTMSMALELAPLGIRVNAVCPGFIETKLTKPLIDNPAAIGPYLDTIPMGRVGLPEEIADAALFLASSDSRYMTGHCMVVDGGQMIKLS